MLNVEVDARTELPQALYRPPLFAADRMWPLIVFLHGAGERGRDGRRQTLVGIGPALARYPLRYPALVLMPQCPGASHWALQVEALTRAVGDMMRVEPVDPARVYVTGISMGGHGAVALAAAEPARYAALAPICGWAPARIGPRLREIPMWVFHGAADDIVPVEHSRAMVHAVEAAGNEAVRYTEYPTLQHNSWDAAYADEAFPTWLFAQRRQSPDRRAADENV